MSKPSLPPDAERRGEGWQLYLYVAGMTPTATRTLANLKAFCAGYLAEGVSLTVVDLLEHPESAEADQIVAVPTLVRKSPSPVRKIIGDLSDTAGVLRGLGIAHEL